MQHPDLEEDIEVAELFRVLIISIGVQVGCLGLILAPRVFIPDVEANDTSGTYYFALGAFHTRVLDVTRSI